MMTAFKSRTFLIALLALVFAASPAPLLPTAAQDLQPVIVHQPSGAFGLDETLGFGTIADSPGLPDDAVTSTGSLARIPALQSGEVDLALVGLSPIQAVADVPLVLGKATAVRVKIALPANARVDAKVTLDVNGMPYEQMANLVGPQTTVTLRIDEPRVLAPVVVKASVTPTVLVSDPNPTNNTRTVTFQTVQTTEKIVAFFLPVDWTPEEQSRHNYGVMYKKYVQGAADFFVGAYPLAADQLIVDFTTTPHMLKTFEKTLADSAGKFNYRNALALYGGIAIAGRRYRPDAAIVIGVLPPDWFSKHGKPKTLGLALTAVKGTVTGQFDPGEVTTAAHEVGHLYALYEDYDYAIKPPRPGVEILVPVYWVQREQEPVSTPSKKLWTYMSAGSKQVTYWTDRRIYEYLLAKFALQGGTASGPLILAATMGWEVEKEGDPADYSANIHRFESTQPVYCSVAGIALKAGSRLEVKLYRGNTLTKTDRRTTVAGNKWYPFLLADANALAEGTYRVEVYLDGQLVRSDQFEVKGSQ